MTREETLGLQDVIDGFRRRSRDCLDIAVKNSRGSAEETRLLEKSSVYEHCAKLLDDEVLRLARSGQ